ncbi:MAG: type IV pilus secretin PilQ [Desulfobacteraceae bacterium]|nr:type IV pilus secretin PilQ [Desulfobacteraceae bacterium]
MQEIEQWQKKAEESKGYSPTPRDRSFELQPKKIETITPASDSSQSRRALPTRKISMKMHMTDVPVLLRALARSVDLNIMINEGVSGKISINVNDAQWDKVFTGILNSQGLSYEWEGDIVRIITIEDRDRHLKNLEAEEKIMAKKRELQIQGPLVTKIIPVDFAQADKLKESVEKVLTTKKPGEPVGTIMVDKHTNSLIVQATASDIEQIIAMVTELDRPTPQILIEAFIVETSSRTARELGVTWGGLYANSGQNAWIAATPVTQVTGVKPGAVDPTAGAGITFPANLNNATQEGTGMALGVITQGTNGILAMELSALEEAGKLNILSSPSITTLDNTKAVIESGDEVPIPVQTRDTLNVLYKQALLSLEVTPHVIQEDALKLEVVTTKNEVDFTRTVLTYPTIVSKKAETNVLLFDGQTMVIGGLKKNTNQNAEAGVPWLSKIPLLGYLFKNDGRSEQNQELLIFITPRILKARPGAGALKPVPEGAVPNS